MAWDNVPWIIGGGVEHSVETCRMLAYAAFGGVEGIVGSKDLEVTSQSTANNTVRVWPGACAILDRSPAGAYQAFAGRHLSTSNLTIAATAGAARSDLIIARVRNPYYAGSPWPDPGVDPAARQAYDYIEVAVISGVPANTKNVKSLSLGYSAIALARIDMPANASVVIPSYIVDLRVQTNVQRDEAMQITVPTAADTLTSASYVVWPSEANMNVDIPDWATHADVEAILGGIQFGAPGDNAGAGWNVKGNLRMVFAQGTGDETVSNATGYDVSNDGGRDRVTLLTGAGDVKLPPGLRGTTRTFKIQGRKNSGSTDLIANLGSAISLKVTFKSKPETNL